MLIRTDSDEALTQSFTWQIPARYNIGVDACDKWADGSGRPALIYERNTRARTAFVDSLPMTPTGKIIRRALRDAQS